MNCKGHKIKVLWERLTPFFTVNKSLVVIKFALFFLSSFPFFQLTVEQLAKLGVQCLKPDYIAEYLSKGEVQAEAFYINDIKPFLSKHR